MELLKIDTFFSNFLGNHAGLLLAAFISIISVANPFSTMPIFVSLTEHKTHQERASIAKKAAFYVFLILTLFLIAGSSIISFFGISIPGIRVAGGLIILQTGWAMLSPDSNDQLSEEGTETAKSKKNISFSPLALPMLAGPGSISVVLGLTSQVNGFVDYVFILVAIILCAVASYIILRIGPLATKYINPTGMDAFTRLMGFIVMALAVQFLLSGIKEFFMT